MHHLIFSIYIIEVKQMQRRCVKYTKATTYEGVDGSSLIRFLFKPFLFSAKSPSATSFTGLLSRKGQFKSKRSQFAEVTRQQLSPRPSRHNSFLHQYVLLTEKCTIFQPKTQIYKILVLLWWRNLHQVALCSCFQEKVQCSCAVRLHVERMYKFSWSSAFCTTDQSPSEAILRRLDHCHHWHLQSAD